VTNKIEKKPVCPASAAIDRSEWERLIKNASFMENEKGAQERRELWLPMERYAAIKLIEERANAYLIHEMVLSNYSDHGAGLLSTQYTAPQSNLIMMVPGAAGSQALQGIATRCEHISGRVHKLGLYFEEPVTWATVLSALPV